MTEQFIACLIIVLLYFSIPCIGIQVLAILLFTLEILRTLFFYQYLATQSNFMCKIAQCFWLKNRFRIRNTVITLVVIYALYFSIYVPIYVISNSLTNSCLTTNFIIDSSIPILAYVALGSILFCIVKHRLYDKIGLRLELLLWYSLSLLFLLISVLLRSVYNLPNTYFRFAIMLFSLLFLGIMPLLYSIYFDYLNKNRSVLIRNIPYDVNELTIIAKELFCLENILFLSQFDQYCLHPSQSTLQLIKTTFILINSPHQLNLSQELRQEALQSIQGLYRTRLYIQDLVTNNILPFIAIEEDVV